MQPCGVYGAMFSSSAPKIDALASSGVFLVVLARRWACWAALGGILRFLQSYVVMGPYLVVATAAKDTTGCTRIFLSQDYPKCVCLH